MTTRSATSLPTVATILVVVGVSVLASLGVVDGGDATAIYTLVAGYAFGKVSPQPAALHRDSAGS